MSKAIVISKTGGPEVMRWGDVDVAPPASGEITVRHTAVGLNYIDVYFRTGVYPAPALPFVPGLEAAGVVEALGEGVSEFKVGERVAYAARPLGAYCERRNLPAAVAVSVPDGVSDEQAAAMMLKGMTAEYLLHRTYPVGDGDTILIHAAAGGVGLIACQWAKHLGATVIGTVSTSEKAELAKAHGCDHPLMHDSDWIAEVKKLSDGRGVAVVYDSIGKDTFERSLDCLRPRGLMVSFGQSSGPIAPLDVGLLSAKGSLFLTRPTLFSYTSTREELVLSAGRLMDVVSSGAVSISVNQTFALSEAGQAHRALESRRTTGSTVLLP